MFIHKLLLGHIQVYAPIFQGIGIKGFHYRKTKVSKTIGTPELDVCKAIGGGVRCI